MKETALSDSHDAEIASRRGHGPLTTIAYAQTLDGRIATSTGESQWISSGAGLEHSHALRASHDAILVGVGTVLRDNPKLTVRLVGGRDPLRVILDSSLRIPLDANVLGNGLACNTLVAMTADAPLGKAAAVRRTGAQLVSISRDGEGRVSLPVLWRQLAARGIRSLLVEGGAAVITNVLRLDLADRMVVCIAPKILGLGLDAVGDLGIASLSKAVTFRSHSFRAAGDDVLFDGLIDHLATSSDPEEPLRMEEAAG